MPKQKIELGDRVKDNISGTRGIVVAITDWLYNCRSVGVKPEKLHEGKPVETIYIDEDQLTVVTKRVIVPQAVIREGSRMPAFTGGPERTRHSRSGPSRTSQEWKQDRN